MLLVLTYGDRHFMHYKNYVRSLAFHKNIYFKGQHMLKQICNTHKLKKKKKKPNTFFHVITYFFHITIIQKVTKFLPVPVNLQKLWYNDKFTVLKDPFKIFVLFMIIFISHYFIFFIPLYLSGSFHYFYH